LQKYVIIVVDKLYQNIKMRESNLLMILLKEKFVFMYIIFNC